MSIQKKILGISSLAASLGMIPLAHAELPHGNVTAFEGESLPQAIAHLERQQHMRNLVVEEYELPWVLDAIAQDPDSLQDKEFSLHIQVKARTAAGIATPR